jgi:iron complex outermembrane receptor protein
MYSTGTYGSNLLAKIPLTPANAIDDFKTYRVQSNILSHTLRDLGNVSMKVDQETPIGTITAVSQYSQSKREAYADLDYSPAATRVNDNPIHEKAFNQDLRLTSKDKGKLQWLIGAFYQRTVTHNDVFVTPNPAAMPPFQPGSASRQYSTSTAWAVYGQADLALPTGFGLSTALRYDSDRRYDELTGVAGTPIAHRFDAVQPSVTLKREFSGGVMAYASVGRGFRSGGFNAANLIGVGAQRIYPAEKATNYEIGAKALLFDRRLSANLALYRVEQTHAQFQQTIVVPKLARFITTIDAVRVSGFEAELSMRFTSYLTGSVGMALNDAKIRKFQRDPTFVGNLSPNVYYDKENVSLEYRRPIHDRINGLLQGGWERRGRISYDVSDEFMFKPVNYFNSRIGIQGDSWQLSVYGRNLTNRRAPEFFSPLAFLTASGRLENQPRNFGVDLGFSW